MNATVWLRNVCYGVLLFVHFTYCIDLAFAIYLMNQSNFLLDLLEKKPKLLRKFDKSHHSRIKKKFVLFYEEFVVYKIGQS